jgi:hypothetical protein
VMLRDCMEEETAFICKELGVTSNHLFVTLHRARSRLRESLRAHACRAIGGGIAGPSVRRFPPPHVVPPPCS